MKLSRRRRYWLKWNGPHWDKHAARDAKAKMGRGEDTSRWCATAYVCRHRGWFPETSDELARLAGTYQNRKRKRSRKMIGGGE